MSAPTEVEIRTVLAERLKLGLDGEIEPGEHTMPYHLRYWAQRLTDEFTMSLYELVNGTETTGEAAPEQCLWADLRPSEAKRIGGLMRDALEAAVPPAQACIVDAITTAALRFAAEFPDAPRGRQFPATKPEVSAGA